MESTTNNISGWFADLEFERLSLLRRAVKGTVINPMANFLPAGLLRAALRFGKSELAAANWADPGGWRSMVISYSGQCRQIADKILVSGGTMPMALRNRKRLGGRMLARLIDACASDPVHVLCLGAGPGQIIAEALAQAQRTSHATLVDISSDAFEYGRSLATERGISHRVRFIQGDVRDVGGMLDRAPDIVKMLGICEYLSDEQIVSIARSLAGVMKPGAPIVFNSLSMQHGTDRFFRRVFGLHMTYRTAAQLEGLLAQAGFGDFEAAREPLGVYDVLIGRRMT